MQNWFIILNPTAGSGKGKKYWEEICALLTQANIDYDYAFTSRKGHSTELAMQAIKDGFRKIIAVGGDGTSHEVMNGIFQQKEVPTTEITYALIPVGTGNDWLKTHKIPNDIAKVIDLIRQEKTALQDIGLVKYHHEGVEKERYFMNVAGMAYDGFVGKVIDDNREAVGNKISYLYLVLKCLSQFTPTRMKIFLDGELIEEDLYYTMNVGICNYNGGGMNFVPHAIPDDGLLALTTIQYMPKWAVILSMPMMYTTKLASHPKVKTYKGKHIRIEAAGEEASPLEADGEYLGETPMEFSILEKSLKYICL